MVANCFRSVSGRPGVAFLFEFTMTKRFGAFRERPLPSRAPKAGQRRDVGTHSLARGGVRTHWRAVHGLSGARFTVPDGGWGGCNSDWMEVAQGRLRDADVEWTLLCFARASEITRCDVRHFVRHFVRQLGRRSGFQSPHLPRQARRYVHLVLFRSRHPGPVAHVERRCHGPRTLAFSGPGMVLRLTGGMAEEDDLYVKTYTSQWRRRSISS
ncbi:hypothetical protein LXA43DRAFT_757798 [Ganoderma leucocontextum]|nr:hypothetical protein LXA43DRAFT_757798 [Ganoderma leucocontextum]